MERIITYNFSDNFIDKLSAYLCDNFLREDKDLSRVACVFGGRRPALFLRRELSKRIKSSFFPPRIFSMDDFVEYIISKDNLLKRMSALDEAFLIYTLIKKRVPSILRGRAGFSEFLPWAREIISFIEQLDLEDIQSDSLNYIEESAAIGYEVPQSINILLRHIAGVRRAYQSALKKNNVYSRGLMYLEASKVANRRLFDEFEAIIFCNFFYLHNTEKRIIGDIYKTGKGFCIFQGSQDKWPVLKNNAERLGISIRPERKNAAKFNLSLYQGFDIHSQVCLVREILNNKIEKKDNTVIVLSRPEAVIPLLTEVSSILDEVNISVGYPLARSPLYTLLDTLLKAHESRKDNKYYTRDYLDLIRHPLVKNLKISKKSSLIRVMVHKIEDLLLGSEESSVGGSLFLSLDEIEQEDKIYSLTAHTLGNMDIKVSIKECKAALCHIHALLLGAWSQISNFSQFADSLIFLLNALVEESRFVHFAFNIKVIEKLYAVGEELKNSSFSQEKFDCSEIWEIFQQKLRNEMVSFIGSPLRGIQILGSLEVRSLNFENVIVMDANESVLPKLKVYEPLVPREVMLSLGLNRLEQEEEIQRYQFMRLISGAKNVYLVYEEKQEKEKSRFVEELLWERQKEVKKLEVAVIPKASFSLKIISRQNSIKKNAEMMRFLKKEVYSASRINVYLKCPLQFYYRYVLGLKEKEDLLQDPQAQHIGTFIHELLEDTFKIFEGRKPVIDAKFRSYFFKKMDEKFSKDIARRMKSDSFLLKRIIVNRMVKFLDNEVKRNVSKLICLEEDSLGMVSLNNEPIEFKYTIDRIDEFADKSVVIIDYKTGGADVAPKNLAAFSSMKMTRESIKENIKSFQMPLYYYFILQKFPGVELNSELYNLRTMKRKAFISGADLKHKEEIMEICLEALALVFAELFNPGVPFEPDKNERSCRYCPFVSMC